MPKLLALLFLIILSGSCFAQCDNTKPMYGKNCIKSPELVAADEKFIASAVSLNGTRQKAAAEHFRFGFNYLLKNDLPTAMKRFNQAWMLNQQEPRVYTAFGIITEFLSEKDSVAAQEYYKTGKSLNTKKEEEAETYAAFLEYFEMKGETATLMKICNRMIKDQPKALGGFFYKKRAYYNLQHKNFAQSEADFNKALEIDPKDANTYYNKGTYFREINKMDEARAEVEKAVKLDPNFKPALAWLFRYWEERKDPEKATPYIDKLIYLDPKEEVYYLKTRMLLDNNRTEAACACIKTSEELGHENAKKLYRKYCK